MTSLHSFLALETLLIFTALGIHYFYALKLYRTETNKCKYRHFKANKAVQIFIFTREFVIESILYAQCRYLICFSWLLNLLQIILILLTVITHTHSHFISLKVCEGESVLRLIISEFINVLSFSLIFDQN